MSSSYYSQPGEGWNTKIPLGDEGFASPYTIATITLNGLWLLTLLIIAVWAAFVSKSRSGIAPSGLKLHKFWIAIVLAILYYTFEFAYLIVTERYYEVTAAYILVQVIFGDFGYLADVILLAVVFGLLFQLLQRPGTGYSQYRGILYAHYAFCGVLFVLYLAIFGISVRGLYNAVFNGEPSVSTVNGRPVQYILDVTYDVLYACASFEVLVISISILLKHRTHGTNNNSGILLIALIAFPLFVRHFFILGFHIAFELEFAEADVLGLSIAETVIAGLAWALAFAGVITVSHHLEYTDFRFDLENRALPEGPFAPSHAPPSAEPSAQFSQNTFDRNTEGKTGTG